MPKLWIRSDNITNEQISDLATQAKNLQFTNNNINQEQIANLVNKISSIAPGLNIDAATINQIITKYNSIPLVKKVNPDLTDYTTNKAMEGVFKMIAVEEKEIRTNLASRSSDLLKKVFALQDKK